MALENITALDDDDDNCFSFYLLSPAVTELWTLPIYSGLSQWQPYAIQYITQFTNLLTCYTNFIGFI